MKKQPQLPRASRGRNALMTTLVAFGLSWGSVQPSWAEPGALMQLPAPNGCIAEIGDDVTCTDGIGLNDSRSVTVSSDGKHVYVASFGSDAVAVFVRNKATGVLVQLAAPNGCIAEIGDGITCTDGIGLNGASDVTVSKDGENVYVSSIGSDAVSVFARNAMTGALSQLPAPNGCLSQTGNGVTCIGGLGLDGARAVAISKDGKHVYVASFQSDAVTVFAREQ